MGKHMGSGKALNMGIYGRLMVVFIMVVNIAFQLVVYLRATLKTPDTGNNRLTLYMRIQGESPNAE